jgi:hypothetical protein
MLDGPGLLPTKLSQLGPELFYIVHHVREGIIRRHSHGNLLSY